MATVRRQISVSVCPPSFTWCLHPRNCGFEICQTSRVSVYHLSVPNEGLVLFQLRPLKRCRFSRQNAPDTQSFVPVPSERRRDGENGRLSFHFVSAPVDSSVLRLEFTALSWRSDLSLGLWGRAAAAAVTSQAPRVKRHWGREALSVSLHLEPDSALIWHGTPVSCSFLSNWTHFLKGIKRCIHFSPCFYLYLIHVYQREAGRDHHNVPGSS